MVSIHCFTKYCPCRKKAGYLIVLGSYVHNGQVTPLLKSRVGRALAYYEKQAPDHKPKFIVSGGQGPDEDVAEATAMKTYLLTQKVPERAIIVENASRNTFENFMFSKEKILQDWSSQHKSGEPLVIFSTSNYHVMRSSLYSKKVDLRARRIGAPTPFYFLPTALIREYIGILSYYKYIMIGIALLETLLVSLLVFKN
ncbi:YdcF family protein [uncultured Fructobacillus sp.]|uniref:YdcF family protein n=1 Tax=uncultured Fructobacillus sp. TaxID=591942 RepID=UPI0025920773|nr:YdcF family protein [uncultured Fructobacillus sp.]